MMTLGELIESIGAEDAEALVLVLDTDAKPYVLDKPSALMEQMTEKEKGYVCSDSYKMMSADEITLYIIRIYIMEEQENATETEQATGEEADTSEN